MLCNFVSILINQVALVRAFWAQFLRELELGLFLQTR